MSSDVDTSSIPKTESTINNLLGSVVQRLITMKNNAKDAKDEIIKKSGEYIVHGKNISKELYNKSSGYYNQVKDAIAKRLGTITDMTQFASKDSVNNLFANTFKNTTIILKHIKTFFALFVTILILNIKTIIEIVKLYANTAAVFIANFGVTAESTNEQDPYFKIFGDYWIQVVKEIYLFLNPTARDHFKNAIVEVVSQMAKDDCPTINPDNQNPMQLFIDNARLGVNLGAFYFFKYSSASAAPVMDGDPTAKNPTADSNAPPDPSAPPATPDPSAPPATPDPSAPPATPDPTAPPATPDPTAPTDSDTAPPTTEEINALGPPEKNMKKLIENNILLYMLLTGHKDPKIICQHFVGYVNTNLKTELNNVANPPDFSYDNLAGDSVNRSDDINEITSPLPSKNGKEILNNSSQDKPTGGKRKTKTKTKRRTKKRKTKRR